MSIYQHILQAKEHKQKLLAVLIDPEKIQLHQIVDFIRLVNQSIATHIFVGGSTDEFDKTAQVVAEIKKYTILPVLLFPGDGKQITEQADGILFLSLLSGRNPEYLIEQQVQWALTVKETGLESIPTGYILIDGGKETSVTRVSETHPIPQTNTELILKTAIAGELLGKKLIYLEAGSGATDSVANTIVELVAENLSIPLIVGGGIRTKEQLDEVYQSGADLIVIGTVFENNPAFFEELKKSTIDEGIH